MEDVAEFAWFLTSVELALPYSYPSLVARLKAIAPAACTRFVSFTLTLTLVACTLATGGCASRESAIRAQRVGGSMLAVGTIVTVVGLARVTDFDNEDNAQGFVVGAGGAYVATAGFWTLIAGSISREVLRQRDQRLAPPASMMPTGSSATQGQLPSTTISDELDTLVADVCSLVPDDCISVRACLLYQDAPACAAVETLVEAGVLSGTVWRYAQLAADEAR